MLRQSAPFSGHREVCAGLRGCEGCDSFRDHVPRVRQSASPRYLEIHYHTNEEGIASAPEISDAGYETWVLARISTEWIRSIMCMQKIL